MSKTIEEFIEENRPELDACAGRALSFVPRQASCDCPKSGSDHHHAPPRLDDDDLRGWILNDEGLYRWARREGVEI